MSKFNFRILSTAEWEKIDEELWEAILSMKQDRQMIDFLRLLFTSSELVMFTRRIRIAKLLLENKSHLQIRYKLRVGFSTIHTVERWLLSADRKMTLVIQRLSNSLEKLLL